MQVWALQDLGVLASSRVLNSKEPLRALVEISQNFPFIAPSLTKRKVDRALEDEVEQLQHSAWGPGFSGAFINGRELPIGENDLANPNPNPNPNPDPHPNPNPNPNPNLSRSGPCTSP